MDSLPDDPLARARAVAEHAPAMCADTGCAWYHGTWPLWRALGIASAPDVHEAFYRSAITSHLAEGGGSRVLVTGSADAEMLATAWRAFRASGATPHLTVIDRCETPLALARAWATARGVAVRALRADVLDVPPPSAFDLVLTHAFLGYFDEARRPRLARWWRDALAPGGALVTINRVRPDAGAAPVAFTRLQSDAFIARVRHLATGRWDEDDAAARAAAWTGNMRAWPLRDADALAALLRDVELRPALHPIPTAAEGPAGPGTPAQAVYVGFVATRPSA